MAAVSERASLGRGGRETTARMHPILAPTHLTQVGAWHANDPLQPRVEIGKVPKLQLRVHQELVVELVHCRGRLRELRGRHVQRSRQLRHR